MSRTAVRLDRQYLAEIIESSGQAVLSVQQNLLESILHWFYVSAMVRPRFGWAWRLGRTRSARFESCEVS